MDDNGVGNFRLPKQGLVSRMRLDLTLLVVERTDFLRCCWQLARSFRRQRFDPPIVHLPDC